MPALALIAGVLAAPLAASAVNERSLLRLPSGDEYRFEYVMRDADGKGWPFSVDEGWLLCIWFAGTKGTYFHEIVREPGGREPRTVVISTDPVGLVLGSAGNTLLASGIDLEEMIPLLGPFEQRAKALCELPPGTVLRPDQP